MSRGIIYILTNEWMPDLIKIGITTDLEKRLSDLYKTGVPAPFEVHAALEIDDYEELEKHIHGQFKSDRVQEKREFFELPPEQARHALELLKISNSDSKWLDTKSFKTIDEETGKVVDESTIKKPNKPRLTFDMVGIPTDGTAVVTFTRDSSIEAVPISNNEVEFEGEVYSLSGLTRELMTRRGELNTSGAYQGAMYFEYEGELLADRRKRFEED